LHDDLTFFTNESGATILDRFRKTLKDVQFFDILVGYFRTSGFFRLYKSFDLYGLTSEEIEIVEGFSKVRSI